MIQMPVIAPAAGRRLRTPRKRDILFHRSHGRTNNYGSKGQWC